MFTCLAIVFSFSLEKCLPFVSFFPQLKVKQTSKQKAFDNFSRKNTGSFIAILVHVTTPSRFLSVTVDFYQLTTFILLFFIFWTLYDLHYAFKTILLLKAHRVSPCTQGQNISFRTDSFTITCWHVRLQRSGLCFTTGICPFFFFRISCLSTALETAVHILPETRQTFQFVLYKIGM